MLNYARWIPNPPNSEQGHQNLQGLSVSELLALKTKYNSTFAKKQHSAKNVQHVHDLAEEQVSTYAKLESKKTENSRKKIVAFAVTFVVSRPYVTKVH